MSEGINRFGCSLVFPATGLPYLGGMESRYWTAADFRDWLKEKPTAWHWEEERHLACLHSGTGPTQRIRLPLPWPSPERGEPVPTYLERVPEGVPPYLLLLVQLGAAALGMVENEEVIAHKSIKKYMKRHKRGKAQIQYLNTRGKSKAGSRIRLANTVRFFEEINEKLIEWEDFYGPNSRILYACTPSVWGMMFQAEPAPPFDKKDPRLIKVPMDVRVPTHEEWLRVRSQAELAHWVDEVAD